MSYILGDFKIMSYHDCVDEIPVILFVYCCRFCVLFKNNEALRHSPPRIESFKLSIARLSVILIFCLWTFQNIIDHLKWYWQNMHEVHRQQHLMQFLCSGIYLMIWWDLTVLLSLKSFTWQSAGSFYFMFHIPIICTFKKSMIILNMWIDSVLFLLNWCKPDRKSVV